MRAQRASRSLQMAHVLYGAVGSQSGIGGLPLPRPPRAPAQRPTLAISRDLGAGTAVAAVRELLDGSGGEPMDLLPVGACGFKVLQLLTGAAHVAALNLKTSLWDTCATEALLRTAGGQLTNLFGWPIEHVSDATRRRHPAAARPGYGNRLGVVASSASFASEGRSHAQLCALLSRHPQVA